MISLPSRANNNKRYTMVHDRFQIHIIENFNERVMYVACNFLIFKLPDIFRKHFYRCSNTLVTRCIASLRVAWLSALSFTMQVVPNEGRVPSTIQQPIFPSSSTFRIPSLYPVSPSSLFAVRGACLEQQSNAEKFLTRTRMSRTLNTHIAVSPDLHFTMGHYRRLIIKDRLFS